MNKFDTVEIKQDDLLSDIELRQITKYYNDLNDGDFVIEFENPDSEFLRNSEITLDKAL